MEISMLSQSPTNEWQDRSRRRPRQECQRNKPSLFGTKSSLVLISLAFLIIGTTLSTNTVALAAGDSDKRTETYQNLRYRNNGKRILQQEKEEEEEEAQGQDADADADGDIDTEGEVTESQEQSVADESGGDDEVETSGAQDETVAEGSDGEGEITEEVQDEEVAGEANDEITEEVQDEEVAEEGNGEITEEVQDKEVAGEGDSDTETTEVDDDEDQDETLDGEGDSDSDGETTEILAPGENEDDPGERLPFLTDEDVECMDATAAFKKSAGAGFQSAVKTFEDSKVLKEEDSGVQIMGYSGEAIEAMKSACGLKKGHWAFVKTSKFTCVIKAMEIVAMHVHNFGVCVAKTDECLAMTPMSFLRADLAASGFNCWEDKDADGDSTAPTGEESDAATESSENAEDNGTVDGTDEDTDSEKGKDGDAGADEDTDTAEEKNNDEEEDGGANQNNNKDIGQTDTEQPDDGGTEDEEEGNKKDSDDTTSATTDTAQPDESEKDDKTTESNEEDPLFSELDLTESEKACMLESALFIEKSEVLESATAAYQQSVIMTDPTRLGYTTASAHKMEQVCDEEGGIWSFIKSEDVTCTIKGRDRCINVYNFGNCISNDYDCQSMDPFVLVKGFFFEVLNFPCRPGCHSQSSESHKNSPNADKQNDNKLSSKQNYGNSSSGESKVPSPIPVAIVFCAVAIGLIGYVRHRKKYERETVMRAYEMTDISDLGFIDFT